MHQGTIESKLRLLWKQCSHYHKRTYPHVPLYASLYYYIPSTYVPLHKDSPIYLRLDDICIVVAIIQHLLIRQFYWLDISCSCIRCSLIRDLSQMTCITLAGFCHFMTTHPCLQGTIPHNYKSINLANTPP